jgi:hypothetical protein
VARAHADEYLYQLLQFEEAKHFIKAVPDSAASSHIFTVQCAGGECDHSGAVQLRRNAMTSLWSLLMATLRGVPPNLEPNE